MLHFTVIPLSNMTNSASTQLKNLVRPVYKVIRPIFDPRKVISKLKSIPQYSSFWQDLREYERLNGLAPVKFADLQPQISGKTSETKIDPHYFYQSVWAFRLIYEAQMNHHVDVGSSTSFVSLLTAITNVEFVDIRPMNVTLDNFKSVPGSILSLPYADQSLRSVSCLHVIEHIGLGRYGDPIDPYGSQKAAVELTRVLAPGGSLYLSLPIGRRSEHCRLL